MISILEKGTLWHSVSCARDSVVTGAGSLNLVERCVAQHLFDELIKVFQAHYGVAVQCLIVSGIIDLLWHQSSL